MELEERSVNVYTSGNIFKLLKRGGAGICVVELYNGVLGIHNKYSAVQK